MNDKYLVLRVADYRSVGNSILPSCLELVWEVDGSSMVSYDFACRYAEMYSKQNKMRTVVVKGTIFGE